MRYAFTLSLLLTACASSQADDLHTLRLRVNDYRRDLNDISADARSAYVAAKVACAQYAPRLPTLQRFCDSVDETMLALNQVWLLAWDAAALLESGLGTADATEALIRRVRETIRLLQGGADAVMEGGGEYVGTDLGSEAARPGSAGGGPAAQEEAAPTAEGAAAAPAGIEASANDVGASAAGTGQEAQPQAGPAP